MKMICSSRVSHVRIHGEQHGRVRLGGQRDQDHPLSGFHDQLMQQLDGMQRRLLSRRLGQPNPAEPVDAMRSACVAGRAR